GQALAQVVAGLHFVFDDQDLHCFAPTRFVLPVTDSASGVRESRRNYRNVMSRSGRRQAGGRNMPRVAYRSVSRRNPATDGRSIMKLRLFRLAGLMPVAALVAALHGSP